MPQYIYASTLYPSAAEATAASLYDYASACGSDRDGAIILRDELGGIGALAREAQREGWALPYYDQDDDARIDAHYLARCAE